MALIEAGFRSGQLLYAVIHANGQVWHTGSLTFENYNSAHWTSYAISLSEQTGSGYYSATYPSQIPAGTLSTEVLYQQIGGAPALGDPLVTIGQSQGVNMQNIAGSSNGVVALGIATSTEVIGAAISGTLSTTKMSTDLGATLANSYQGRTIIWTSGALTNCAASILGYVPTNGVLTFTPVPTAPSAADTFIII